MVGDIAHSIWKLNQQVEKQEKWDFFYFIKAKAAMDEHVAEGCDDPRFPMDPRRVVKVVRRVMPDDGIIALDNGVYKIWFARNYPARLPNTVLLDNALATMGAGLPSAMAAKIVYPDRKVVAICGDGGFMMNSQELETAVRLKQDLVVLILNDSAYGMIKWKQAHMAFEGYGLDFDNPCFCKYAEAYGASGHRIKGVEELEPLLGKCLDEGGVHLIDLPVDYSDNDRILNQELPERSRKI